MEIAVLHGCKKIKSLLGFAEIVKQSSNYFNEAVDALIFACRQKRHDIKGQNGRSMIEMLGVLAIIGILSVGGLVGYSKAIDRYRVNETINQVTYIAHNTRNLFRTQKNFYGSLSSSSTSMSNADFENRKLADKAQIFPTSIIKNDYKNLFDGDIKFYTNGRFTENDGKAFILSFYNIPQKACIEIVTRDWQSDFGLIGMAVHERGKSKQEYFISTRYSGNCTSKYTNGEGVICATDMPLSIEQAVRICGSSGDNYVTWKFY